MEARGRQRGDEQGFIRFGEDAGRTWSPDIRVSQDDSRTWLPVSRLCDFGRHHPSLGLMPDGGIVMTYVVRLGYPVAADGMSQFGVEAIVSTDNGASWDFAHRYVLAKWTANRTGGSVRSPPQEVHSAGRGSMATARRYSSLTQSGEAATC